MKATRDITEVADSALKTKEEALKELLKACSIRWSVGFLGHTSPSMGTDDEDKEATDESTAMTFKRDICSSGRVYKQSAVLAPELLARACHSWEKMETKALGEGITVL